MRSKNGTKYTKKKEYIIFYKKKRCGMIANETTLHKRLRPRSH